MYSDGRADEEGGDRDAYDDDSSGVFADCAGGLFADLAAQQEVGILSDQRREPVYTAYFVSVVNGTIVER